MRRDGRLCVALHVLLHMSDTDEVFTSEALASTMNANPVVLRRTLAGLRDAAIVRSEKGHGGGWSLARPLSAVMLSDVYDALGLRPFNIGHRDAKPECALERAVNRVIGRALDEAEAHLVAQLRSISVADITADAPRTTTRTATKRRATTHA
jgi:DNA-binding IscR family transcriptional regulator